jgi:hypothetical protein
MWLIYSTEVSLFFIVIFDSTIKRNWKLQFVNGFNWINVRLDFFDKYWYSIGMNELHIML